MPSFSKSTLRRNITGITFIAVLLLAACAPNTTPAVPATVVAPVTIMTFNVENLFDTTHDDGKTDSTFLPLAAKQSEQHKAECATIVVDRWRDQCLNWDWSETILAHKLEVVAKAILQVNNGRGPDILALQEVENLAILERLRTEYLADAGYRPAILIEGQDLRGIDVAFLTRLEVAGEPVLHPFTPSDEFANRQADTRGILEATFKLPDGELLTGFSVHFPAPFHPTEMRIQAYKFLNQLRSELPEDRFAFAAGDFNTTSTENEKKDLLGTLVRGIWRVAHEEGCANCLGTQYYEADDKWSYLDMILWAQRPERGAQATWDLRKDSVKVANKTTDQVTKNNTPARFLLPEGSGVSDHWPLLVSIEFTQKQQLGEGI